MQFVVRLGCLHAHTISKAMNKAIKREGLKKMRCPDCKEFKSILSVRPK